MPQENKTMGKNGKENTRKLRKYKRKPKSSGEEVKEIHSKINILTNQQTPPQKKPEENNTKSIIEYLEKKLQLPTEYGRNANEKAYKTKTKKKN